MADPHAALDAPMFEACIDGGSELVEKARDKARRYRGAPLPRKRR
jgi:hypothetical protein